MSSRSLTPVSFVVLGLIARDGPLTPYDVKAAVARGIAHFWPFPHSQIYSETDYLTSIGLLAEEREQGGRRRRTFRLTDAGRQALETWLRQPTSDPIHLRSYAFLKLYFGYFGRPQDVLHLANTQVALFETQCGEITQMVERLRVRTDRRWQMALAEMYADLSRAGLEGWKRIAARAAREVGTPTKASQPRRTRRRVSHKGHKEHKEKNPL
jgi:DNA-binding PadR family transcriptional regulator